MTLENELFKICKVLMLFGGVWMQRKPNWSKFSQNLYKVFSLTTQTFYVTCLPLFSIELCSTFATDMEAAINASKGLTFVAVIVANMVIVQSKKITHQIEAASNKEASFMTSSDPEIKKVYKEHVAFSNISSLVLVFSLYLTGYTYIADGLYRSHSFYKDHPNATATTPKPHPVQVWLPFNKEIYYKTSMAYEIAHIVLTLNYSGATQALVNSVLVFLKAEMKILQYNVRHVNTCDVSAYNALRKCAIKHQALVRWVHDFNASFQHIILFEYCVISLTFASALIEIIQGKKLAFNGTFFLVTTLQLFLLAWNSNEILLESSSGLADALYDCTWYSLDASSKVLIQFMIMRCRKPLKISIGPFGCMTLDAAISRLKLAYSVVSVLSTSSSTSQ